ncbi:transposase [Seohaeicola saemankumensis]|uniref:transposase n=1 Tax=Seohaeicola TaxID=481178 RepID=UPI0035D0992D
MAGKKGQKKRVWSDEEKASICTQARVVGVSVAQVARRYAMNANLIHKWLRDPRFSSEDPVADLPVPEGVTILPVEVAGMTSASAAPILPNPSTSPTMVQRLDITLSDGRRILVEGATALSAVLAIFAVALQGTSVLCE